MQKPELPSNMILLGIYGIWSKEEKRVIYISLDQEEVELEFDMEGYPDETHAVVFLNTAYDISSLGQLSQ